MEGEHTVAGARNLAGRVAGMADRIVVSGTDRTAESDTAVRTEGPARKLDRMAVGSMVDYTAVAVDTAYTVVELAELDIEACLPGSWGTAAESKSSIGLDRSRNILVPLAEALDRTAD